MSNFPKSSTSSFVRDYPFSIVPVTAEIISRFFDVIHYFFFAFVAFSLSSFVFTDLTLINILLPFFA